MVVSVSVFTLSMCKCVSVCLGWWSVCLYSPCPCPSGRCIKRQLTSLAGRRHDVTWRHRDALGCSRACRLRPVLARYCKYLLIYFSVGTYCVIVIYCCFCGRQKCLSQMRQEPEAAFWVVWSSLLGGLFHCDLFYILLISLFDTQRNSVRIIHFCVTVDYYARVLVSITSLCLSVCLGQ